MLVPASGRTAVGRRSPVRPPAETAFHLADTCRRVAATIPSGRVTWHDDAAATQRPRQGADEGATATTDGGHHERSRAPRRPARRGLLGRPHAAAGLGPAR